MYSEVALQQCPDYDHARVKNAVRNSIDLLGGIGNFVQPDESVLLKPNLLAPADPERAVTTHPAIVKAVAELVLEARGKPFIADSPSIPGFKFIAKKCGMAAIAESLDVPIMELKESAEYRQGEKKLFRILEISKKVMEADRIINLPKLKTHSQMFMTMGVKNIFGCVVGRRKAQWHFKAGIDRAFFARMLVELYDAVSPDLTIMDGIVGMEGDGPGMSGTPRAVGLIASSTDAVALDRVFLEITGGKFEDFFVLRAAREMKVGQTDLANIMVMGDAIEARRVENFRFPNVGKVVFGPKFIQNLVLNHFTAKPKEDREKCTLCSQCVDICPTEVIRIEGGRLRFNYDKCIRCYCCVEVCPEGAMKPTSPFLLKVVG